MFEDKTPEGIKQEILEAIDADIDIREGSYTNDIVSPVALELWKYYQMFNEVLPIVYVDDTSGEYIDKKCAMYGITRKAGDKAQAVMHFTGTAGTSIPQGKVFITPDNLEFEMLEAVTLTDGTGSGIAQAVEEGAEYNVAAGTIAGQYENISGLDTVTNDAADGGVDPETDAALVERLYDYLQKPATSGNVYHYEQWAKEVPGVGAAKVTPLWDGEGTVRVLIVDQDRQPVTDKVVTDCAAHIETQRPIGADVTVQSAAGKPLNIYAKVRLESSTLPATVQAAFAESLDAYVKQIAFVKYEVLYNRVAFMLLDIDGVIDYDILTINGGTSNVTIGPLEVPVLGTVEVVV